jgi:hypothetical protein
VILRCSTTLVLANNHPTIASRPPGYYLHPIHITCDAQITPSSQITSSCANPFGTGSMPSTRAQIPVPPPHSPHPPSRQYSDQSWGIVRCGSLTTSGTWLSSAILHILAAHPCVNVWALLALPRHGDTAQCPPARRVLDAGHRPCGGAEAFAVEGVVVSAGVVSK